MAKKADRKPHPSELRRGDKSVEELRQGVADIRRAAAALDSLLKRFDERSIESIHLDGVTKLDRGIDLLKQFNMHVRVAYAKTEGEAGD